METFKDHPQLGRFTLRDEGGINNYELKMQIKQYSGFDRTPFRAIWIRIILRIRKHLMTITSISYFSKNCFHTFTMMGTEIKKEKTFIREIYF